MQSRLAGSDLDVLEISADATEQMLDIGKHNEVIHLLMSHGRLTSWWGNNKVVREMIMPPSPVKSTSAASVLPMIVKRLACYANLSEFQACIQILSIVFVIDAASSCSAALRGVCSKIRRLPLHNTTAISVKCQAHQLVLNIADMLRLNRLPNGLYCLLAQCH